jgi:hypothetical protein
MNPKVRQTIYLLGPIVPAALGIALLWGGIDAGTADNLAQVITGFLSLLSAGVPLVAAKKVSEQRQDGTLTSSSVEQVVRGVEAVIQTHAVATAELEQVKQAVTSAVGVVPGIGPLAAQVINSVPTPYSR